MKKYIYSLTIIVASLFYTCSDYLDVVPDNVATIDNAFTDKFNTEKFLYTIYAALPSAGDVFNPGLNTADEVWYPRERNWNIDIPMGRQNVTTPELDRWAGTGKNNLYVAINNCNIFLNRIEGVRDMTDSEKELWTAEVNFLKAYYHFYLVQMYGPIVINDEEIIVSDSADKILQVRSSIDECFTYIIDLLDKAIVDLPLNLNFEVEELGRVNKLIAASIKAKVLMTYASPLFNGNSVYTNFKNSEGEALFPSAYDPEKWNKAVIACKKAIDLSEEAGIKLYQKEDYQNAFQANLSDETLLTAALRDRITKEWNNELIWGDTQFAANGSTLHGNSMTVLFPLTSQYRPAQTHAATMRIAELYYSENGVPIDEDVSFDYANRFKTRTASEDDKFHVEVGEETAVLNFNRETRFYSDLSFDRCVWYGNGKQGAEDDVYYIHKRSGEFAGPVSRSDYNMTGYAPKKLIGMDTEIAGGTRLAIVRYPFPIIRLADLYLYYAEALNESKTTPDSQVYEYIDLVRDRAGLEGVVSSWSNYSNAPNKPLTKEGMRKIIQQERLIEFTFEGGRFWDLRRWKLLKDYMNKPIKGWSVEEEALDDYYTPRVIFSPTFSEKDYFYQFQRMR
ncbi:RagB/SusD family nutrient uptake outer membrane protein [Thalassobellus suaedae]|uniref:RagB/SusD family nutrient uptake outer membrane protein n=1 Tax=Thalassobellus suaedae TaxID=3074124 RepID=A0ABY9XR32_9FLAO|nr:RagB/SusD family nutrient uptake outer membrane protein [Flavobacteriaceae bacterium HL-DH14]